MDLFRRHFSLHLDSMQRSQYLAARKAEGLSHEAATSAWERDLARKRQERSRMRKKGVPLAFVPMLGAGAPSLATSQEYQQGVDDELEESGNISPMQSKDLFVSELVSQGMSREEADKVWGREKARQRQSACRERKRKAGGESSVPLHNRPTKAPRSSSRPSSSATPSLPPRPDLTVGMGLSLSQGLGLGLGSYGAEGGLVPSLGQGVNYGYQGMGPMAQSMGVGVWPESHGLGVGPVGQALHGTADAGGGHLYVHPHTMGGMGNGGGSSAYMHGLVAPVGMQGMVRAFGEGSGSGTADGHGGSHQHSHSSGHGNGFGQVGLPMHLGLCIPMGLPFGVSVGMPMGQGHEGWSVPMYPHPGAIPVGESSHAGAVEASSSDIMSTMQGVVSSYISQLTALAEASRSDASTHAAYNQAIGEMKVVQSALNAGGVVENREHGGMIVLPKTGEFPTVQIVRAAASVGSGTPSADAQAGQGKESLGSQHQG